MLVPIRSALTHSHTNTHTIESATPLGTTPAQLTTSVSKYLCCSFSARNVSFVDIFLTAPAHRKKPAASPARGYLYLRAKYMCTYEVIPTYNVHYMYLHMFLCMYACIL